MTEEEKPLTREDVLKMIEEHGGTAEGLDLSRRNLRGIDLSSPEEGPCLDLHGIVLKDANLQNADLCRTNFQKAIFDDANLQQAKIWDAKLQKAHLSSANLQEAQLYDAKLQGAFLIAAKLQKAELFLAKLDHAFLIAANLQDAKLYAASLQHAFLSAANLQKADLSGANLQCTDFSLANLQEANLRGAKLSKATLYGAKISPETRLENVDWGADYILGDEQEVEQEKDKDKKREQLRQAESVYRILKQWHTQAGMYDIAGEFYFREMTVRRKTTNWRPNPLPRAWSKFLAVLCGYGEKPLRVVASAAVVVFGLAGIYSVSALTFPSSLYHSVVSFTALGYGLGVSNVDGWVKALGAAEAFMGVFMMALFLITFVRKMTR